MRYLCVTLVIFVASCNVGNKRDFFKSVKDENLFLDTFLLSDLKKFGISDKSTLKNNKVYYAFNAHSNYVYTNGFLSKNKGKIFFLPENSERELLLVDMSLWNTPSQILPQKVKTKNETIYEVVKIELTYNNSLKDSVLNVEMRMSNILNKTESLIFEITKNVDIFSIEHINCKSDTLVMKFFTKQEVYFTYINKLSRCL